MPLRARRNAPEDSVALVVRAGGEIKRVHRLFAIGETADICLLFRRDSSSSGRQLATPRISTTRRHSENGTARDTELATSVCSRPIRSRTGRVEISPYVAYG